MRIEATDERERTWQELKEATGETTKAGALDVAADYYIEMRGGTLAHPDGAIDELLEAAVERGGVTPEEIAAILDCSELPIDAETDWNIGRDDG